jgi:glycerol kinase
MRPIRANASRTLLFNIHTLDWDDELLVCSRFRARCFPGSSIRAEVRRKRVRRAATGIAVAGIAGDQQAALFGQACYAPGMAKNTYGTGCFLLMNTARQPASRATASSAPWPGGAATRRVRPRRERLHRGRGDPVAARRARDHRRGAGDRGARLQRPGRGGVFFVPALSGLGAPYWDPHARGTIVGITRGSTRAHLARATLEAIAFQSAELIEAMAADSGIALKELRVDGGATRAASSCRCRPICSAFRSCGRRYGDHALGRAYLAGLATGFWSDEREIAALWSRERVFEPRCRARRPARGSTQWKRAVARARGLGSAPDRRAGTACGSA